MRTATKYWVGLVIILVMGGIGYGVYFIYNNTSLFSGNISNQDLADNNQNQYGNSNLEIGLETIDLLNLSEQSITVNGQEHTLNLPKGFNISVFADGLAEPRFFTFTGKDNMVVADKGAGKIYLLKDENDNGQVDQKIEVDSGLRVIHSVHYYQGDLYAAEENQVSVYRDFQEDGSYSDKEILISDLPSGRGHSTRTVIIGPDDKIYLSIGSSCNVCEEEDLRRAAIVRYDLDGSNMEIFASGLRNSVGLGFFQDQLWAVNNGRDKIGDDRPTEEVNIIEQDKHYGWPYCWGAGQTNPEFSGYENFCQNESVWPVYEMQAHSAPLGLAFLSEAKLFPADLLDNLFITFHGSWNRTVSTGYKVVRINPNDFQRKNVNFITGWLQGDGSAWGRPVGVGFDQKGMMYVSDDRAGVIYRVTYQ